MKKPESGVHYGIFYDVAIFYALKQKLMMSQRLRNKAPAALNARKTHKLMFLRLFVICQFNVCLQVCTLADHGAWLESRGIPLVFIDLLFILNIKIYC